MPWRTELAQLFWRGYTQHFITRDDQACERIQLNNIVTVSRANAEQQRKEQFLQKYNIIQENLNAGTRSHNKYCEGLTFWIKYLSWTYCSKCRKLNMKPMTPICFLFS